MTSKQRSKFKLSKTPSACDALPVRAGNTARAKKKPIGMKNGNQQWLKPIEKQRLAWQPPYSQHQFAQKKLPATDRTGSKSL